jgi:hypothetical protein
MYLPGCFPPRAEFRCDVIAPELQRFMSKRAGSKVVEIKGSHAIYVSRPDAVATLIEKAAKGAQLAAAR